MKNFDEFFETDKDNNFFLKKDIKLNDDSKKQLLVDILEIQKNMATEYIERNSENQDNDSLNKKIS